MFRGTVFFCFLICLLITDCHSQVNCSFPCLTCSIEATNCTSCPTNSTPALFYIGNNCLQNCPALYFKNNTAASCDSCSSLGINCVDCQNNLNCSYMGGGINCLTSQEYSCISCDSEFYLYFNSTDNINQCLARSQLPDGYVGRIGSKIAQLCQTNCLICSFLPNNCTSCVNLSYHQGQCLPTCPETFYSDITIITYNTVNISTTICVSCPVQCRNCTNITICTSCASGFYFNGSYCVNSSVCPLYTYPNSTLSTCQLCSASNYSCLQCSSYDQCTSCVNGTFLLFINCLSVCPSSYYSNTNASTCTACVSPCATCTSDTACLSCTIIGNGSFTFYYPYNNSCLLNCPVGFYKNQSQLLCSNCTLPCLECDYISCFRCSPLYLTTLYYLYNGQCFSICPIYYFQNQLDPTNYTCQPCDSSCYSCSILSTNCTSCNTTAGYKSVNSQPNTCVLACPSTDPVLKIVSSQQVCYGCSDPLCSVCSSLDKCIVCLDASYVMFDGVCLVNCPTKYNKLVNTTTNSSYCEAISPAQQEQQAAEEEGIILQLPINFPSCIVAGGLLTLSILIKLYQHCKGNSKVLLFPLMSAALSIPQFATMCLSTGAYFLLRYKIFIRGPLDWDVFIYFYCICLLLSVIVGLYVLVVQIQILWSDSVYKKWNRQSNCLQKLFQYVVNLLTILNFKITHVLWSGIKSLPLLEKCQKLTFLNRPSGFSVLVSLVFIIISVLNITYHPILKLIYLDSIIVVTVSMLLSLLALRRPHDFFIHQLDGLPDIPVNKRVVSSDNYLVSGLSPIKDQDYFYSKLNKKQSQSDLISDSGSSSRSAYSSALLVHPSNKTPSVHLQNVSLQCTVMEDKLSQKSASYEEWSSTDRIPSVVCQPASKSIYQGMMNYAQPNESDRVGNDTAYIPELDEEGDIHPTNDGIFEEGENESHQAENDEYRQFKYVLPLQFRRYAIHEEAPHNYSMENLKEQKSIINSNCNQSQRPKQLSYELDSDHASMALVEQKSGSKKQSSISSYFINYQEEEKNSGREKSMSASVNSKDPQAISVENKVIFVDNRSHNLSIIKGAEDMVSVTNQNKKQPTLELSQSRQMNLNNSIQTINVNAHHNKMYSRASKEVQVNTDIYRMQIHSRKLKRSQKQSLIAEPYESIQFEAIQEPMKAFAGSRTKNMKESQAQQSFSGSKGVVIQIGREKHHHNSVAGRIVQKSQIDQESEELECMNVSGEVPSQFQQNSEVDNTQKHIGALRKSQTLKSQASKMKQSQVSNRSVSNRLSLNSKQSQKSKSLSIRNKSSISSNLSGKQSFRNGSIHSNKSRSKSLKSSQHSISEKMKSSVKGFKQKQQDFEKDILQDEAESIQMSSEGRQSIDGERKQSRGNQFRIKSKKRRGKKQKELVLYIDDKKYKILKKEAEMLNKQIKANEKMKNNIKESTEQIYRSQFSRMMKNQSSRQKKRSSLTKQQRVYLTRNASSKAKIEESPKKE